MAKNEEKESVIPKEVLRALIKDYKLQTAEHVQSA